VTVPVMYVRVPEERLGVIIGTGGGTRRTIAERTGAEVEVEGADEAVRLSVPDSADPIGLLRARDIVLAIGRGFSPERAFRLLGENTYLAVVDIKQSTGKRTKSAIWRIRSRIIGREGRARERLEELSGCAISVQGTTVAIIGDEKQLVRASRAVQLLLRGSEHATVFRMLAHARRDAELAEALLPAPTDEVP
jgi:ribosomal RNA assembly protein